MRPPRPLLTSLLLMGMGAAGAGVDVNHASEAELDGVRGLGPDSTRRILAARSQAPFRDWADFSARVPGIGPVRAARLSEQGLTVQGQAYTAPSPASKAQQKTLTSRD